MSPFDNTVASDKIEPTKREAQPFVALIEAIKPLVAPRKYTELKSAAKLLCTATRRDVNTWLVAEAKDVIDPMHAVHPLQADIDPGYWKSTCSRITLILKLNGFRFLSGHALIEMSPDWAPWVEKAKQRRPEHLRALLPFIGWCINRRIGLAHVSQACYEAYCREVDQTSQRKNKTGSKQSVRRGWNFFAKEIDGWSEVGFTIEDKRDIYHLPGEEMPAAVAEFDARAHVPFRGSLRYGKRRRRLRKATIKHRHYLFRRVISAAVKGGIEAGRLRSIADVCDREVLETAYNFILDRQGDDVEGTCDVSRLASLMFAVAEQWVGVTGQELDAHRQLVDDFECIQEGMAEKNKRLLAQFSSEKVIAAFLKTPARVMAEYDDVTTFSDHDCIRMQMAGAMALLTRVLVRMDNLKQIRINVHLKEVGWGQDRIVLLIFGEDEVKNAEYLETLLSPRLVSVLDVYRKRAWLRLCRKKESNFLFPGYGGNHKSASTFGNQLAEFVFDEIGIRVTPHQFRHLGGYFHLLRHPEDYASVQKMLGHKRLETTIKFYTGTMARRAAFEKYDAGIEERLAAADALETVHAKVRVRSDAV